MEEFKRYFSLVLLNEDLKTDERILNTAVKNIKEIKTILMEKENDFCTTDQQLRNQKCSIKERCNNLIDHLVHYKCIIECLSADLLAMESKIIDDDQYINLSLVLRDAELNILKAIRINQKRNERLSEDNLQDTERQWCSEHQERRQLLSNALIGQHRVIVERLADNLNRQQALLNQRYQSINNMIKMWYNPLC